MRKLIFPFVLALLVGLAACGGTSTSTGGPAAATAVTVTMGASTFDKASTTLATGGTITFVDDKNAGVEHLLAYGQNGIYKANTQGPTDLNTMNGLMFQAGESKTITFPTAGTYQITCIIHPAMNLTVTVK